MTVMILDNGGEVLAYSLEGKLLAKFEPNDFYIGVLSPRQLRRFEKNPLQKKWEVRKIDFVNYKKET